MYIPKVRADGYAVQSGHLAGEVTAFQSGVDGFDDHVLAGLVTIDLADQIPQGGFLRVFPAGVGAFSAKASAQGLSLTLETAGQHLAFRIHSAADAEGVLDSVFRRGYDAQAQ